MSRGRKNHVEPGDRRVALPPIELRDAAQSGAPDEPSITERREDEWIVDTRGLTIEEVTA